MSYGIEPLYEVIYVPKERFTAYTIEPPGADLVLDLKAADGYEILWHDIRCQDWADCVQWIEDTTRENSYKLFIPSGDPSIPLMKKSSREWLAVTGGVACVTGGGAGGPSQTPLFEADVLSVNLDFLNVKRADGTDNPDLVDETREETVGAYVGLTGPLTPLVIEKIECREIPAALLDKLPVKFEQESQKQICVWTNEARKGTPLTLPKIYKQSELPKTVYIEPMEASEEERDLVFKVGCRFEKMANAAGTQKRWVEAIDRVRMTVLKVDLDVDADHDGNISDDDPDEPLKVSIGGIVSTSPVCSVYRDEFILRKVEPLTWDGHVVLSLNSTKVKVFTAAEGGNEITFNGSDNRFLNADLPKSLWVQGEALSDSARDIALTLTSDPGGCLDSVRYTCFKVEPEWGPVDQLDVQEGSLSGDGDGAFSYQHGGDNPTRFSLDANGTRKRFYQRGFGHQFYLKTIPADAPVETVDMTSTMDALLKGAFANSGPTPYSKSITTWGMCEYLFPAGQLPQREELFSENIDIQFCASGTDNFIRAVSPSRVRTLKVGENEPGQFGPFTDRYLIWLKVRGEASGSSIIPFDAAKVDLISDSSFGGFITNKDVKNYNNPH